jgi:hypothetical protein
MLNYYFTEKRRGIKKVRQNGGSFAVQELTPTKEEVAEAFVNTTYNSLYFVCTIHIATAVPINRL